tara:strand:- start:272 stop:523 length:252 start_codon:yes stop_codon:yes gene_type:complete
MVVVADRHKVELGRVRVVRGVVPPVAGVLELQVYHLDLGEMGREIEVVMVGMTVTPMAVVVVVALVLTVSMQQEIKVVTVVVG